MTIILFGDLSDNQQRNEIELLTRELRRAWARDGYQVVSEIDGEKERRIKVLPLDTYPQK